MKHILQFFFLYILLELILYNYIKKISKINKWILIKKNFIHLFNKKKFYIFKKNNYNYDLGWEKKPKSFNYDTNNKKKIFYSIDKKGYRTSRFSNKENLIATFGDSYTFCRQVGNLHTWQEFFSIEKRKFVSNYGVGNYGLDQVFLKYKKTKINKNVKFIVFGFVPETICRIQSCWKYYLEFGNLHGFKPFCSIKNNKLYFSKNLLKPKNNFNDLEKIILKSKSLDRFYKIKYKKHIFEYPFVISFLKNFLFNISIFIIFIKSSLKNISFEESTFPLIMKNNIKMSHKFYREKYSTNLLAKLIKNISDNSKKNTKCFFVIFPQLFDLKLQSRIYYQNFFKKLKNNFNIIDLTNDFLFHKNYEKLFINDKYGGHLNKKGNLLVANILKNLIK